MLLSQEIGLGEFLGQLDAEHADYLKDTNEKGKFKPKPMTEEDFSKRAQEQNLMFERIRMEEDKSRIL